VRSRPSNEVEDLTTGLARKIWQKLTILYAIGAGVRRRGIASGRGLTAPDEEALLRHRKYGIEKAESRAPPEGEAEARCWASHPTAIDPVPDADVEGGQDAAEGRAAPRGVHELQHVATKAGYLVCRSRGRRRRGRDELQPCRRGRSQRGRR